LHRFAGAVFGTGQERHVKGAAEHVGRLCTPGLYQGGGLFQCAKRQKLVDADPQKITTPASIDRGVEFGEQQGQEQLAQGRQGVVVIGGQAGSDLERQSRAPKLARQAGDGGGDQADAVGRRAIERGGGDRFGQGTTLLGDRRLVDCADTVAWRGSGRGDGLR
jgi:hypothetical protein